MKDLPSEATGEAEYFRLSGLRSKLGIPLRVGGRFVANIGFAAFSTTQTWPDHLIVKLKLLGEAFALALARKRAEEKLTHALAEIEQLRNGNKYLPTEHVLCSRFGLTAAEARVALGIARGETIASVAGRHNVTVSTARSQLKSVFSKLGAHRQAELVALLGGKLFIAVIPRRVELRATKAPCLAAIIDLFETIGSSFGGESATQKVGDGPPKVDIGIPALVYNLELH